MKKGTAIYTVNEWLHENCKKDEILVIKSSPTVLTIMKNSVFAYKVSKKCSKMLGCKNGKHEKLCPLSEKVSTKGKKK
jgi:hypothetical protein